MAKKSKLKTPDWVMEGYESKVAYEKAKGIKTEKKKGKTFKIRVCPKCGSDDVGVVVGKEKAGEWQCNKCKWTGTDIQEKELTEDELMEHMDKQGEEVA